MRRDRRVTAWRGEAAQLPTGSDKRRLVRSMFDAIAPRYELVNDLMTFGLDRSWRRRALAALELAPSTTVLDLACGTADFARALEHAGYRAVGVDLSPGMLAAAHGTTSPLLLADALRLPFADRTLDGCISGFALRNLVDLEATFAEIARVVVPGGRIALLEVDRPGNPLLGAANRLWCEQGVPRLGALLSDPSAYRYLPRSYAYLPGRDELLGLLRAAGFVDACHLPLTWGVTQVITATRAGARPLVRRSGAREVLAGRR